MLTLLVTLLCFKELHKNKSANFGISDYMPTIIKDSSFDTQYIVGVLNSKPIQYYYQQKFKAETELFPKIRIKQAKQLPIPIAESDIQNSIAVLITQIIAAKKANIKKPTEKYEKEIDKIVYELYGLTDDEIGIIEDSI